MIKHDAKPNNKVVAIYYCLLLLAVLPLTRPYSLLPEYIRLAYLTLVIAPLPFYKDYIGLVISSFISISLVSFAPILPTQCHHYLIVAPILILARPCCIKNSNILYTFILFYFLCIEITSTQIFLDSICWWLIGMLIALHISNKKDVNQLEFSFTVVSCILSLLFLIHADSFMAQYGRAVDDMQRASWINPNLFGACIAIGAVISLKLLLESSWHGFYPYYFIITIIISLYTLILNASRGAILAFILPSIVIFVFMKIRLVYKVSISVLFLGFLVLLYNQGAFRLLELRMGTGVASAGGRTDIWSKKIDAFMNLNPINQLFGVGYYNCVNLGIYFDTHNDFMTALCAYGLVGLFILISLLFYPLICSSKSDRPTIASYLLLLVIECAVLSPMLRGYFLFIMFYIMILKRAQNSKNII